jgi:hypothetical protein
MPPLNTVCGSGNVPTLAPGGIFVFTPIAWYIACISMNGKSIGPQPQALGVPCVGSPCGGKTPAVST